TRCMVGRGDGAKEVSAAEAVNAAAELLKKASNVTFAASPLSSNEDLLAAFAFARDALKVKTVYVTGRPNGEGDDFLLTADKNPNRKGLTNIATAFGFEVKPFSELESGLGKTITTVFALGAEVPTDEAAFAS